MLRKIVIASDSFKGSLSSKEVGMALEEGVREVLDDVQVVRLSVADGGEGTLEALRDAFDGQMVSVPCKDPLLRDIRAEYMRSKGLAVMEMASSSGLTLLDVSERNPMKTSTFGLGQMILDAYRRGARQFLVGLGGSATNDGGTGMMSALGARFLDRWGQVLAPQGSSLSEIRKIDLSGVDPGLLSCRFSVACDVDTVFSGPSGAAFVFAPQKGADEQMVRALDEGMRHFEHLILDRTGCDLSLVPGSGAAGGLGGAFRAFLDADLRPGVELVLEAVGFDRALEGADLVLTGEGRVDFQTPRGKTCSGILRHARSKGVPVIAFGGSVDLSQELLSMGFAGIYPVVHAPVSLQMAMRPDVTRQGLRQICRQVLTTILTFSR